MRTMQEWRDLWLAALESGKFRQGRGRLATRGNKSLKYCCLGVACEIYAREHSEEVKITYGNECFDGDSKVTKRYNGYLSKMPLDIMGVFGITDEGQNRFIELNDDGGLSFKEIATEIRKNPENFFT